MFHIKTKPQNRNRIFIIFAIGGIWGIVDMWQFKGIISFVIDGVIVLVFTVILGNITHFVLKKIGIDLFSTNKRSELILDADNEELSKAEIENKRDIAALNYGIIWALFILISSLL